MASATPAYVRFAASAYYAEGDIERFRSLAEARQEWVDRRIRGFSAGDVVAVAWVADPPLDEDAYPDKVLVLGPRGAVRWRDA